MIDIASAFQSPDGGLHDELVYCLDYLNSLDFFKTYKAHSWGSLEMAAGARLLDVACGLGFDAIQFAGLHSDVRFTGVDVSEGFLEIARSRGAALANLDFVQADSGALPFEAGSFDGARIDRALQHIVGPLETLREMARVVKPGGRIVAVEPDWGSFILYNGDIETSDIITRHWLASFRNPTVGRQLAGLAASSGVIEARSTLHGLFTPDLDCADKVFDLRRVTRKCVELGLLSAARSEKWWDEARDASERRTFFASLCLVEVAGRVVK